MRIIRSMPVPVGFAVMSIASLALVGAAPAHSGPHPGTSNPWLLWTLDPIGIFGPLVFGYLYFNGLRKWPNGSHPVRTWQQVSFAAGQLLLFISLCSPIDPLSDQFFFMHQIQHLLLRVMAPVLILLGAPLTPVLRGLPAGALQEIVRPVASSRRMRRFYSLVTNPIVTLALFIGALWIWQAQPLQNLVVRNTGVHLLMHFSMFASAMLYWWLVIDPMPHRSRVHYGLRVLYVAITIVPNTVLGAMLVFSRIPLYAAYGEAGRIWPTSALNDQIIGGLILWLPPEMMSVTVAGIIFVLWFMHEERLSSARAAAEIARRRAAMRIHGNGTAASIPSE
ncbi:MAG: cytochrome c oxidase assembly protein [Chloroflexi bacterium]|nr:cytochrome c oxidase assembly protein [Chloroflexota bacterium]